MLNAVCLVNLQARRASISVNIERRTRCRSFLSASGVDQTQTSGELLPDAVVLSLGANLLSTRGGMRVAGYRFGLRRDEGHVRPSPQGASR